MEFNFKGIVAAFLLVACCILLASAQMPEQEAPAAPGAPDMTPQNWYHRRYYGGYGGYGYGYPYRYGGYYPSYYNYYG